MDQNRLIRDLYCALVTAYILIVLGTLLMILVAVYKAESPITTVDVIVLKDLRMIHNNPTKVTVGLNLCIKNPNKLVFKYNNNSSAVLIYKGAGAVAGDDFVENRYSIESGQIFVGKTKAINVTLTILADDGLLGNYSKQVHLDSNNSVSTLLFHIDTRISGKVTFLNMVKYNVCSTSYCDFQVNVGNRTVGDQKCGYIQQKCVLNQLMRFSCECR